MAKLPIKGHAQRLLDEALEKLKEQGKLKQKKKKPHGNNKPNNSKSNKP